MRFIVKAALAGVITYAGYRAVKAAAPQGVERFLADVRAGMAERDGQLREALGLDHPGAEPMTPSAARAVIDDPTGPAPR
ncbi:MAG: hypothetical protein ABI131_11080 [Nostocoides sp.]